jgi:hypothetical protein
MATHILRYASPPRAYKLTDPTSPHSAKVGRWTIYEDIQAHPQEDLRQKGLSEYRGVMEAEVVNEEEMRRAGPEASIIASELENLWIYTAARPFHFMRLSIQPNYGPTGWNGNVDEVKQAIRQESGADLFLEIQWNHRNSQTPPFLPLETTLKARAAYLAADATIQQMVDLHVAAFKHSGQPRHVLLAGALEIAGSYYPDSTGGYSKVARNSGLQKLITDAGQDRNLTQTIEWLFNTANSRREIRHAWNQQTRAMHPKLSPQEAKDYVRNADLILRVFICTQLELPIVIYQGQL